MDGRDDRAARLWRRRRPFGWGRAIAVVIPVLAAGQVALADTVFRARFETGPEAFTWIADAFLGTQAPEHAEGAHRPANKDDPAALEIVLGDRERAGVQGMSGAWQRSFATEGPMDHLRIRVRYRITMASGYEPDEFVQLMIELDGRPVPGNGLDYVHRMNGDGDGGPDRESGWIVVAFDTGRLAAGSHVLRIGAYGNKRTASDESTRILIDEVEVSGFADEAAAGSGVGGGAAAPRPARISGDAFQGVVLR